MDTAVKSKHFIGSRTAAEQHESKRRVHEFKVQINTRLRQMMGSYSPLHSSRNRSVTPLTLGRFSVF